MCYPIIDLLKDEKKNQANKKMDFANSEITHAFSGTIDILSID